MTRTGEEAQSEIEIDVDCSRTVDNPAVAERVVTQVTVRVGSVELRCWRELGCGVSASISIVGWTRTLGARTMSYVAVVWLVVLLRTGLWTVVVVVRLVVRAVVDIAVVWTVVWTVGYVAVVWTIVRTVVNITVVWLPVLVVNTALGADIAHVVVIVSAGIHAGVVVPTALSCVTVGRRLLVVRSAILRSGSFPVLRIYGSAVLNRIVIVCPWL